MAAAATTGGEAQRRTVDRETLLREWSTPPGRVAARPTRWEAVAYG